MFQGAEQTWRQISCDGYKTIVKQRQTQCIVWDVGFTQIIICQKDICLEPNREKEAPGHHFHSLLPLQKFDTHTYTLGFPYRPYICLTFLVSSATHHNYSVLSEGFSLNHTDTRLHKKRDWHNTAPCIFDKTR